MFDFMEFTISSVVDIIVPAPASVSISSCENQNGIRRPVLDHDCVNFVVLFIVVVDEFMPSGSKIRCWIKSPKDIFAYFSRINDPVMYI